MRAKSVKNLEATAGISSQGDGPSQADLSVTVQQAQRPRINNLARHIVGRGVGQVDQDMVRLGADQHQRVR
jgi:hypothetical protein